MLTALGMMRSFLSAGLLLREKEEKCSD